MSDKELFFEKLVFPEGTAFGENRECIERIWDIFEKYGKENEMAKRIFDLFLEVKEVIQIFPSKDTNYMKTFGILELNLSLPDSDFLHELGHMYYNLVLLNRIPNDFSEILERATEHARVASNISFTMGDQKFNGRFKDLIIELSKDEYRSDDRRDEIGPFSDMISALYLGVEGFATSDGEEYILPYHHSDKYYRNDEGEVKYPLVFDEQFANFFAMVMMNQKDKLDILRKFYGEEWFLFMENTLLEIEAILKERKEEVKHLS